MRTRLLHVLGFAGATVGFLIGGGIAWAVDSIADPSESMVGTGLTFLALLVFAGAGSYIELDHGWDRLNREGMKRIRRQEVGPGILPPVTMGLVSGFLIVLALL